MTNLIWYQDHRNLVALTRYMADQGYDGAEIAYAVEKPWKFGDVWAELHRDPQNLETSP